MKNEMNLSKHEKTPSMSRREIKAAM